MINISRVIDNIATLRSITEPNLPYTRRAFSDMYLEGRQWISEELLALGLQPYIDSFGNLRAMLKGESSDKIYFGSHSDTVPSGGAYDGILGVVAGLEVLRYFKENNITPKKTLAFIDFLAEETTEWGLSCIGSRGLTNTLTEEHLKLNHPLTQEKLHDAIVRMGGKPDLDSTAIIEPSDRNYFVELHIEQGPVLEHLNKAIGVVNHIVGITRLKITLLGFSNHSGTTPMNIRNDALVHAAKIILETNQLAEQIAIDAEESKHYFVATCGNITNYPNAINVIPCKSEIIIDIRSSLNQYTQNFLQDLRETLNKSVFDSLIEVLSQTDPVALDSNLALLCTNIIEQQGKKSLLMTSGAGHDAAFMAKVSRTLMLFTPSVNGISHNPDEFTQKEDIELGCNILLELIIEIMDL